MRARGLMVALWLSACGTSAYTLAAENDLVDLSPQQTVSAVPDAVRESALQAVSDVQLQSVETLWEHDFKVYKFAGTRYMAEYRIFVRSDATLLRVEKNNLDDD